MQSNTISIQHKKKTLNKNKNKHTRACNEKKIYTSLQSSHTQKKNSYDSRHEILIISLNVPQKLLLKDYFGPICLQTLESLPFYWHQTFAINYSKVAAIGQDYD